MKSIFCSLHSNWSSSRYCGLVEGTWILSLSPSPPLFLPPSLATLPPNPTKKNHVYVHKYMFVGSLCPHIHMHAHKFGGAYGYIDRYLSLDIIVIPFPWITPRGRGILLSEDCRKRRRLKLTWSSLWKHIVSFMRMLLGEGFLQATNKN